MHLRAPILPPAYVPYDDAKAVRTPRAIARDALLAFGAAVKIEKLRDGDEDADGTESETTSGTTTETLYRIKATTSRGLELFDSDVTGVPRRVVLNDEHCDVTRGVEVALMNMAAGAVL